MLKLDTKRVRGTLCREISEALQCDYWMLQWKVSVRPEVLLQSVCQISTLKVPHAALREDCAIKLCK